jgi:chaperonin GroES
MEDKYSHIQPIGNKVIFKQDPSVERTKGGLIIPEDAKEKQAFGTIIAVGPLCQQAEVGKRICFAEYSGQKAKIILSDGTIEEATSIFEEQALYLFDPIEA